MAQTVMNRGQIRKASIADAAVLAELSVQLGYPSSAQQTAERLSQVLGSSEHVVLVVCLPDGGVVAWIHAFLAHRVESDSFAELGGFVVAEQWRGHGLGRLLFGAAQDWARFQDVMKLRVRTRSTRQEAQKFYERLGFTQTKEQHVYDKPIRDAE